MTTPLDDFWKAFNTKQCTKAQTTFDLLSDNEKQTIFATLFQKSEFHRKPIMLSVLKRQLHTGNHFKDFYQSWFPEQDVCHKEVINGEVYQQHFPVPIRVLNAINIHQPNEILSVGITWVKNQTEEQVLWKTVNKIIQGKDQPSEKRHQKVRKIADGELLGIFRVETDDNLGTPF